MFYIMVTMSELIFHKISSSDLKFREYVVVPLLRDPSVGRQRVRDYFFFFHARCICCINLPLLEDQLFWETDFCWI